MVAVVVMVVAGDVNDGRRREALIDTPVTPSALIG
jgi:hypothetical protein